MLTSLLIKNYALIEHLQMEPSARLNVITGETGAGKSIMLGAVGVLLGNRADTRVLFNEGEKCIIEGAFNISEYDLQSFFEEKDLDYEKVTLIRREISPAGKSRAFVNDTPVNLGILKELGSSLLDVHSQHETLLLGKSDFQLQVIDSYAGNKELLKDYRQKYNAWRKAEEQYQELLQKGSELKKQHEFNLFQLNELTEAAIKEGEVTELEDELKVLENAEEIKTRLNIVMEAFSASENSILGALKMAEKELSGLSEFSDALNELTERVRSCSIELSDISSEVDKEDQKVEFDPQRTAEVQERISTLYGLMQKHNVQDAEELIRIRQDLEEEVAKAENFDSGLEELKNIVEKTARELENSAEKLSASRKKVFPGLEKEIYELLSGVGMPNASFKVGHEKASPGISGNDKVTLLFSANKGIPPQELKKVASGGEFSRLMLCLKYVLAKRTALPTIIFDEIDTGISGEIAIKVGKMMRQMADSHQLIAISHLPQIAALGNAHYFVYKDDSADRAVSKLKKLSDSERVQELAEMIGGKNPTITAVQSARELLDAK